MLHPWTTEDQKYSYDPEMNAHKFEFFYPTGELKSVQYLTLGAFPKKTGPWTQYRKNGSIISETYYIDGENVERGEYYEEAKLQLLRGGLPDRKGGRILGIIGDYLGRPSPPIPS
jgi:hypothetical protein